MRASTILSRLHGSAFAAASLSHSLIQDNVIYAYGCYYEAECNTGSAPYPFFFAPDGTYDIYDYRDPGELRMDAEAEAMVTGHIHTGAITQDVTAGGVAFLRSVQEPGFYTAAESIFRRRHRAGWRCLHLCWLGEHLPDQRGASAARRPEFA